MLGSLEPKLHAGELLACLVDQVGVTLERERNRADPELGAAGGGRRQHRPLLVSKLGDVMIDQRRQVLRNRQRLADVVCAVSARHGLGHHRGDEQRHPIRAPMQRADERLVPGHRR